MSQREVKLKEFIDSLKRIEGEIQLLNEEKKDLFADFKTVIISSCFLRPSSSSFDFEVPFFFDSANLTKVDWNFTNSILSEVNE